MEELKKFNGPSKFDLKKNSRDVMFAYSIFLTPFGKGYGCFAIKKADGDNKFLIGSSYCHPSDRGKFNKKLARKLALCRTASKNSEYSFDEELGLDTLNIVAAAIENKANPLQMPSWAKRAYKVGSFTYKLSADRHNSKKLFSLLNEKYNIDKEFVEWTLDKLTSF